MITVNDFMHPSHALPLAELGSFFPPQGKLPPRPSAKALDQWKMEEDDAPIFQFLYQTHQPRRHLEFGTWQGWGALLCLESCAATVWTMNLPDGEKRRDGTWAYGERVTNASNSPQNIVVANYGEDELGAINYHRTDAGGYIGRFYREKGLDHRVCQIYCDGGCAIVS